MSKYAKKWGFLSFIIFLVPVFSFANMIANGDFESAAGALPQAWIKGRWGTNTATHSYPVPGANGSRAAEMVVTAYTNGDAKWAHVPVPVSGGTTYRYRDQYKSSVPTTIENEYKMSDGSYKYQTVAIVPPAADFKQADFTFTAPAGAQTVSVFHYLEQVGSLSIDNAELTVEGSVPPPNPANLLPNPTLNPDSSGTRPQSWGNNRYGANTASFTFPISAEGGRGLRVSVSNYTGGDAKWYHAEIPVKAGEYYEFSDRYRGSAPSFLGIQFRLSSGGYSYPNLGAMPAESNWQTLSRSFSVPAGAVGMIVYHAAQGNGTLETAAYSLRKITNDPNRFSQGMLTIAFDDGSISSYENTISVLDPLGLKSTHYIVSNYLSEQYPGYIKPNALLDLELRGHEIGAHTRSHTDLTKLSGTALANEIAGSRSDLLSLGVSRVDTLAYPFGAYNQQVEDSVIAAGYAGARSTNDGQNLTNTDKFALKRIPVNVDTTLAQIKTQVDQAKADRSWVMVVFHNIDNSGNKYSATPQTFRDIANYIKQSAIKVVSVADGLKLMQ